MGEDHLAHDHAEELGRVDCSRGNAFFFTFCCPQHSPYTLLNEIFWDAFRHTFGQPRFAPLHVVNEACLAQNDPEGNL